MTDRVVGKLKSPETLRYIEKAKAYRLVLSNIIDDQGRNDTDMWRAVKAELGLTDGFCNKVPLSTLSIKLVCGEALVIANTEMAEARARRYVESCRCDESPNGRHEFSKGTGICVFCEMRNDL